MRKSITLLCLLFSIVTKAQVASDTLEKKIHFYSSLGLGMIDKSFKPAARSSIQTSTGIEYRFSHHSSTLLMLSFDSYGYQKIATSYNVDGSLKSTALALFYRYRFGANKVRPYLMVGGGGDWLSVPTVTVAQTTTSFKQQTEFIGALLAEAGIQFQFLSRHYFLLGVERGQLAKSSLLDNKSIGTTTFKVGLVSSF
jgi:hypothetical protein